MQDVMNLCDQIREIAYAIHLFHGNGYLEKVYENALVHRLLKAGLDVQQQLPIIIHDEDGAVIGDYFADVVVNNTVLIELKAVKAFSGENEAQILHYLKATGMHHGLLINFGSFKFQIKKLVYSKK